MATKNCPRLPLLLLAACLGLLSSPCSADEFLLSGQSLLPGQSLTNCGYTFSMQTDCNLVLYDAGTAVWASGTAGRGTACRLSLREDGNLVIYSNGRGLWASNTQRGNGNYVLTLQRDRNVVIYGKDIWATDTDTNTFGAGVTIDGARNAAKNETSFGAAEVVANAAAGERVLGRKIGMVTDRA